MEGIKKSFHLVSYLQYPFVLTALYYAYKPLMTNFQSIWQDYNSALVFCGVAISFSCFQDTRKIQNKLSRIVFQNKKYSKIFLIYLSLFSISLLSVGFIIYFFSENSNLNNLSPGLIVLGIGMLGMLKTAVELAENHGSPVNLKQKNMINQEARL
ncbi:hypothetical protein [Zunongwangia sp. H14]|uniref:hypothetical protein n=1 Tax=Zunongwangia sp. H14 TaxID=3240792 RepID=UPI003567C507